MPSSVCATDSTDRYIRAVRTLIEITETRRCAPARELRQHLAELLNGQDAAANAAPAAETRAAAGYSFTS